MGLLARRFDELRARADWLTADDDDGGSMTSAGVAVTARSALTLSTIFRIFDLLSAAVGHAPKDIIIKVGGQSFVEFAKPAWLVAPNPADPNYTASDYFAQVALSLLYDGNYFVSVEPFIDPLAGPGHVEPTALSLLDPGRVVVRPGPLYEIRDAVGRVTGTLGPNRILHGAWMRLPGELRGISPLEYLRRSIGGAIAADEYAGRFFGQGASLSFGVEYAGELSEEQRAEFRKSLRREHQGLSRSHAIGILTRGAKFVTGLMPTPEQAQMLATRKFAVEDLARAFGVPPGLLASQEPGASSYASAEVYDKQFAERAVLPLAQRIEATHARLVTVPASITAPGAEAQFRFNLDAIARVNILTRMQAYGEGIRSGVITPAEARAKEDLRPIDGADRLYMQAQMTPIELLGVPPAPARSAEPARDEELRSAALALIAAAGRPAEPPRVEIAAGAIRVEPPAVTVENRMVPPAVTVENRVEPTAVTVEVTPTPVEVMPAAVAINVPEPKARRRSIVRDAAGLITEIVEEADG